MAAGATKLRETPPATVKLAPGMRTLPRTPLATWESVPRVELLEVAPVDGLAEEAGVLHEDHRAVGLVDGARPGPMRIA